MLGKFLVLCSIALSLVGCKGEPANETTKQTSIETPVPKPSCSDTILPLGLKFGMSYAQLDSSIHKTISEHPAPKMKEYRFLVNDKEYIVEFFNDRLVLAAVKYGRGAGGNFEFFYANKMIQSKLGLYYLADLSSGTGNDHYGTICDDLVIRTTFYGSAGVIYYISIPEPNRPYPEALMHYFKPDGFVSHVTPTFKKENPDGAYMRYIRDY